MSNFARQQVFIALGLLAIAGGCVAAGLLSRDEARVIVPPTYPINFTIDPVLGIVTSILVVATIALAVYTASLRKATVDLATDTFDATTVTDIHHQESLLPICVLTDVTFKKDPNVLARFRVTNVGMGPAVSVNLYIERLNVDERIPPPQNHACNAMKAGKKSDFIESYIFEPVPPAPAVEVTITFTSMFLTQGSSKYRIIEGDLLLLEMTLPGATERIKRKDGKRISNLSDEPYVPE